MIGILRNIALVSIGGYAYYNREQLTGTISQWFARKVDFKVLNLSNFKFNLNGSLSFDFKYQFVNPTPTNITANSLLVKVYQQVDGEWELISENTKRETIIIEPGTNQQSVNMSLPVINTAQAITSSLRSLVVDNMQEKMRIDATISFRDNLPEISYSHEFNPYAEVLSGLTGFDNVQGVYDFIQAGIVGVSERTPLAQAEIDRLKKNIENATNSQRAEPTDTADSESSTSGSSTASVGITAGLTAIVIALLLSQSSNNTKTKQG
jgi:hypothetical protein